MEKETLGSWIRKREEELKSLKKEIEVLKPIIEKDKMEVANYKQEIQHIEGLQNKENGLYEPKSGKKLLIEMKEELKKKKDNREKSIKEYEEKITRSENLDTYIRSVVRLWKK